MTTADDDFKAEIRARLAESGGQSPFDPSANVLALVAAAMQRQDDLRSADAKRLDERFLLRDHWSSQVRKVERRASKETRRYQAALTAAESKRIDAIQLAETRRIDALLAAAESARALANTRAELTATALAERVDTSAKTLAGSVETTAKAFAAAVEATTKSLIDRIAPLEQSRYEQAGGKEQRTESKTDNRWLIGVAMAAPSFLVALVAIVLLLVK